MNFLDSRLPERFWNKVQPCPITGCWLWVGATGKNGHAQLRNQGKTDYSYRVSYRTLVGSIPSGLELDHLCRTTQCVNPQHLEPVTHEENMRRSPLGFQNNKTQRELSARSRAKASPLCKNGHPFDKRIGGKKPQSACSICRLAYQRAYNAKRKSGVQF